jgi:tetratricopeptide (TPR) repeat protein
VARAIAQREGFKAIVDGDVTGVPGGYIVSIRLVRADSGVEMASFRETGDGPRGLIDAADKLARALRAKAGESLRSVNATPPLAQATTSSLDALRKYSEGVRANLLGDNRSIALTREAIAIDSTFASAWSGLGALLSNYGGTRSAIDSALTQAYRYRDRLPVLERDRVVARFYGLGPGRDRAKSISAYESIIQRGDSNGAVMVNIAEMLRTRRDFARAESLNLVGAKFSPGAATGLGNAVEMQLNQGKVSEAAATAARIGEISPWYAAFERVHLLYAQGEDSALHALADSLVRKSEGLPHLFGLSTLRSLSLRDGRLADQERRRKEMTASRVGAPLPDSLYEIWLDAMVRGPSASLNARLDSAIAAVRFLELPMVDRPYLFSAVVLARAGNTTKARAIIARYRTEMTDTSIRRAQEAELHSALGEIALADRRPLDALVEFRRGDVGYDGLPASECAPCLPFNLARAFDAAGKPDSAAVMFERYLSTPYWLKTDAEMDPVRLPAIHERLGQLYESMGNTEKAVEHYRAFIELWKNADPELQARVADARKRLARLTPVEKPRA